MRRLTLAALLSAALLVSSTALAGAPKIDIKPVFGKALVRGAWQPLTITLTDPGVSSGEVSVTLSDQRTQRTLGTYIAPFQAPSGAGVATVQVNVLFPEETIPVVQASAPNVSRKIDDLPIAPTDTLRILVVSPNGDPGAVSAIHGLRLGVHRYYGTLHLAPNTPIAQTISMPRMGGGQESTADVAVVVPITPQMLPTQAAGYDSFGVVCLSDELAFNKLPTGQQNALRSFMGAGGLVLSRASSEEKSRYWTGLGGGIEVPRVAALTPSDWSTLLKESVATSSVSDYVVSNLFRFDSNKESGWLLLASDVLKGQGMEPPPFATIAFFLGLYLMAVVPIQYIILKRLDKREWAWVTTPVLAALFAMVAYNLGRGGRSTQVFANIATISEFKSGNTVGVQTAAVGIYSPERRDYSIAVPERNTLVFPAPDSAPLTLVSKQDSPAGSTEIRDFSIPQWAMRTFGVKRSFSTGGCIMLDLKTHKNNTLDVKITNDSRMVLKDAVLLTPNSVSYLGDLHDSAKVRVGYSPKAAFSRWDSMLSEVAYQRLSGSNESTNLLGIVAQAMGKTDIAPDLGAVLIGRADNQMGTQDAVPSIAIDGRGANVRSFSHLVVVRAKFQP